MSGLAFGLGSKRGPPGKGSSAKPTNVKDLFSADSSDEEEGGHQAPKRQTVAVPAAIASAPMLAGVSRLLVPNDPEVARAAEKLADFVAKNGRSFEEITRQKNPGPDTPFRFLHDKYSSEYKYYAAKLLESEAAMGKVPSAAPTSTLLPPPPVAHSAAAAASRWGVPAPAVQLPQAAAHLPPQAQALIAAAAAKAAALAAAAGASASSVPAQQYASDTGAAGRQAQSSSLAAMEAYMAMAAKKEKAEQEEEEEQEKRARAGRQILNETSFDRRKVTAVYKEDGKRGHHMGDYIPAEELAKFMAKAGGDSAKAAAAVIEARNAISSDNVGHKLLSKMGWKEGEGVGPNKAGITAPVKATGKQNDGLGVGAAGHGELQEDDDPFEAYRKRMQLGYKHRPNPLGNPRKAYY